MVLPAENARLTLEWLLRTLAVIGKEVAKTQPFRYEEWASRIPHAKGTVQKGQTEPSTAKECRQVNVDDSVAWSSQSLLVIIHSLTPCSNTKNESPIRTEDFRSGGTTTLTPIVSGARQTVSFSRLVLKWGRRPTRHDDFLYRSSECRRRVSFS